MIITRRQTNSNISKHNVSAVKIETEQYQIVIQHGSRNLKSAIQLKIICKQYCMTIK